MLGLVQVGLSAKLVLHKCRVKLQLNVLVAPFSQRLFTKYFSSFASML